MAIPRKDHRVILHFDYDCFYASVFEAEQPALKSLPLAVQQKQIVVTCNYEARRRGLRKLQLVKEAKKICPELVIVLGEDLTRFRDASKELYAFIKSFVWSDRVERLGFDEIFLDVTDMVEYNIGLLNKNTLHDSFFHLDRHDPTVGFVYNATQCHGPTWPSASTSASAPCTLTTALTSSSTSLHLRLLVASHLAGYMRSQLEHQKGYTATVGVSTSKLLAKLVGSVHKPNNQTTLLPPYEPAEHGLGSTSNILRFMDGLEIRKVPGIGYKLAHKLRAYVGGAAASGPTTLSDTELGSDTATAGDNSEEVTVKQIRLLPGMGPRLLNKILGGAGAPKDIGVRVWGLLHGVDDSDVLAGRDIPTQISIEDSYGKLTTLHEVKRELTTLTASLIRRMRTDLTEQNVDSGPRFRWRAHPKLLRLSTRPRPPPEADGPRTRIWNRISRSAALPLYVFNIDESIDALAEKLVQEHLLSMFRKLHPEKFGWNLSLLNIAVTNMVESAGEQRGSNGRDIGKMFRSQERVLSEWTVNESGNEPLANADTDLDNHPTGTPWEDGDDEEEIPGTICQTCGALIPTFALVAHAQYHSAPD
ncbi:hypothetical protein ASPZODRAFT_60298 [Penicilliopsis zonata CBS 506.65]|uniref:UmuC domain-containing protein n=1 Tax=Penicilliopsis zonata CBS 506.65 TaxID=1073090 RepID=A0A1L9SQH4_9EURO|nr:hypothetical protein ASPZODRAFT_60298 [Penicilliopsis zonata CBS 506.65]OJJ49470.1 hypothetical protein ASPZODRAFT_60298 [Penicilliopsis zonata CBS 506.65]